MLEPTLCPTPEDTAAAAEFTEDWHRQQEREERAWLDQWVRAEKTPECPWARPDWDVMADFTAFVSNLRTAARRP
ncbi:hypothetical protein [Streptomyces sp. NBC_01483]|uniref:hypothetical protein n=1 Tax=Streptomyces sp. NBC_01483 TaxID=2903883 RepID=UPI002E32D12C|nr:hypothetical protein [Streptomyces sp. NBC_01483]